MTLIWLIFFAAVLFGLAFLLRTVLRRQVVHDYQVGLLYENGKLEKTVGAGAYWLNPLTSSLVIIDTRRVTTIVAGQEITTQDNIGLKVSAAFSYEVDNAEKALRSVQDYAGELYLIVQLALREEFSSQPLEALLDNRQGLGELLTERIAPQAQDLGLKLHSVQVRDFMFSGDLKRAFNDVLKARKEGEAALERVRGESAALRNLANTAKLLDDHPNLLPLRLVQAIETSKGHSFSLGAGSLGLSKPPQSED